VACLQQSRQQTAADDAGRARQEDSHAGSRSDERAGRVRSVSGRVTLPDS
jgi:hypothetical protein